MQILNDISEIVTVGGASIAPQAVTQATAGSSVNMQNSESMTGAVIDFGVISSGITSMTVQAEEWNGLTGSTWAQIPNMVTTISVTNPGPQTLIGLRTQGFCRLNVVTFSGTTTNALMSGRLFGMPKQSSSSGGYSRSPSV